MWRLFLFSKEAYQLRINALIAVFMAVTLLWLIGVSHAIHRIELRLASPPAAEGK